MTGAAAEVDAHTAGRQPGLERRRPVGLVGPASLAVGGGRALVDVDGAGVHGWEPARPAGLGVLAAYASITSLLFKRQ